MSKVLKQNIIITIKKDLWIIKEWEILHIKNYGEYPVLFRMALDEELSMKYQKT
jgi:hypothetical protein